MAVTTNAQEGGILIEGVDRFRAMEPMFECVRVILSYRGENYSPAYIQGISGAAFRIGGICPCASTCACAMETQDLIQLLGYDMEYLPLCGEGVDAEVEVHHVVARVKDEIRQGRPAIVWHAFTFAEWDVVCGFDDAKHQFLGRGSYAGLDGYATADQARTITCTEICPALGAILIGGKRGEFSPREAKLSALWAAVRHAHSTQNQDKLGGDQWAMLYGLLCYDRWISDFEAGTMTNIKARIQGSSATDLVAEQVASGKISLDRDIDVQHRAWVLGVKALVVQLELWTVGVLVAGRRQPDFVGMVIGLANGRQGAGKDSVLGCGDVPFDHTVRDVDRRAHLHPSQVVELATGLIIVAADAIAHLRVHHTFDLAAPGHQRLPYLGGFVVLVLAPHVQPDDDERWFTHNLGFHLVFLLVWSFQEFCPTVGQQHT